MQLTSLYSWHHSIKSSKLSPAFSVKDCVVGLSLGTRLAIRNLRLYVVDGPHELVHHQRSLNPIPSYQGCMWTICCVYIKYFKLLRLIFYFSKPIRLNNEDFSDWGCHVLCCMCLWLLLLSLVYIFFFFFFFFLACVVCYKSVHVHVGSTNHRQWCIPH